MVFRITLKGGSGRVGSLTGHSDSSMNMRALRWGAGASIKGVMSRGESEVQRAMEMDA